jgi:hypothetical protein
MYQKNMAVLSNPEVHLINIVVRNLEISRAKPVSRAKVAL